MTGRTKVTRRSTASTAAIHEAGHAVAGALNEIPVDYLGLEDGDPLREVLPGHIAGYGNAGFDYAWTRKYPGMFPFEPMRRRAARDAAVNAAGWLAEMIRKKTSAWDRRGLFEDEMIGAEDALEGMDSLTGGGLSDFEEIEALRRLYEIDVYSILETTRRDLVAFWPAVLEVAEVLEERREIKGDEVQRLVFAAVDRVGKSTRKATRNGRFSPAPGLRSTAGPCGSASRERKRL